MSNFDSFFYKIIQKVKSKNTLNLFNFVTNNSDIINIFPHLYLGTINSCHDEILLQQYNIEAIVNCTKDIEFHPYFSDKSFFQIDIEDCKEKENLEEFKKKIISGIYFIDEQINNKKNVIVHCYWGLMRSPTLIAGYLIYKYKMDVDCSIQFIQSKKSFTFSHIYNFRDILEYVYNYFHVIN